MATAIELVVVVVTMICARQRLLVDTRSTVCHFLQLQFDFISNALEIRVVQSCIV
jgi:hypothetical protein